ncbi:uncharacterized protein ACBR49_010190 [Aulostomus maculatus]
MNNRAVSTSHHITKTGNKENAPPGRVSKSVITRDVSVTKPQKEDINVNGGLYRATTKHTDARSVSGEAVKKAKPGQKDARGAAAGDARPLTQSQTFPTEKAENHRKLVKEASKAHVSVLKTAPGMYRGKVVQSKIGAIWKSSAIVGGAGPNPPAPKTEKQKNANVRKSRLSVDIPGHGSKKPAHLGSKSVLDGHKQVSRPATTSCPPAPFHPAKAAPTNSRTTAVVPTWISGTKKIPAKDRKVNKPPGVSTLGQYKSTETVEERRAKLAEWMALKGKTLKRPAMTRAAPARSKISVKATVDLKPQSPPAETQQVKAQYEAEPEPSLEAAAPCAVTQEIELAKHSRAPVIMNMSFDLLEDLDEDQQDKVEDIIVNLCDALEALEMPFSCKDELSQVKQEYSNVKEEGDLMSEGKREKLKESDEQKIETQEEAESDDALDSTPPDVENASVVKYCVKTTPYLQSVRKTIEEEVSTSASRRKSNIKDLKFLTPVRRSSRIQRKSSRLPSMLVDHDPCVSSLAELVKLDNDLNAYIYRKNTALLKDLPDEP